MVGKLRDALSTSEAPCSRYLATVFLYDPAEGSDDKAVSQRLLKAINIFRQVEGRWAHNKTISLLAQKADVHTKLGEHGQAASFCKAAIKLCGEHDDSAAQEKLVDLMCNHASACEKMSHFDKAADIYDGALELCSSSSNPRMGPKLHAVLEKKAGMYRQAKEYEKMIQVLEKIAKEASYGQSLAAWRQLMEHYLSTKNRSGAVAAATEYMMIAPNYSDFGLDVFVKAGAQDADYKRLCNRAMSKCSSAQRSHMANILKKKGRTGDADSLR